MTKFLSKIFLSGILLSSVSGYCSNSIGTNINACIDIEGGNNKTIVQLDSDYTASIGINVGTTVFNTNESLPMNYKFFSEDNNSVVIMHVIKGENKEQYIRASTKSNGVWMPCAGYQFNKAELDLNSYTLTINKDKNFTVTNLGQVIGAGTIKLTENNNVLLETGSSIGEDKKEITILGDNNSNKIDLTNYLSLDNNNVIFNADGQKLFLNLKGGQDIHLFDKILDKSSAKQNIINSFNNSSTVLFPNIKAESNTNGNTESFPTLTNIPYLFNVIDSDKSTSTTDNMASINTNNTIKLNSILLEKIFDNNKTHGNVKLKFGDNNISINDILKDLIKNTNNKEPTINVDSFIKYDSSIDVFEVIKNVGSTDLKSKLSVTNCEVKSTPADFSHITTQNITVSNGLKKVAVQNAQNINYIPNENAADISFDGCSNVTFIGSKDSSKPSELTNLDLKNGSNINITGNVKLNGLISGDITSSVNINGKVILGKKETQTIVEEKTGDNDNIEQSVENKDDAEQPQEEGKDNIEQQTKTNGDAGEGTDNDNSGGKGTDNQNEVIQTGTEKIEEGKEEVNGETQALQDAVEQAESKDNLENQSKGSETVIESKNEDTEVVPEKQNNNTETNTDNGAWQIGPQDSIQIIGDNQNSEQQETSFTQQNVESLGILAGSNTTAHETNKSQDEAGTQTEKGNETGEK